MFGISTQYVAVGTNKGEKMSIIVLNIPKKYSDILILGEPKPNLGFNDEEWKSFYEYLTQFQLLVDNLIKRRPRNNEECSKIYFDIEDELKSTAARFGLGGLSCADKLKQIKEKKDG